MIKIITRNSQLAMWQAKYVEAQLINYYPLLNTKIIGITTKGDQILDRSLDKVGGKGLFIKELEKALLSQDVDLAVHSLKDLPANMDNNFKIVAVLQRENPHDAFVSNKYQSLSALPDGAIIGTSSIRRIAILNQYYPQYKVKLLRGNLNTRLKKLDDGEYDAIILACAGLIRLGARDRIREQLDIKQFVPSIGQGAIAVEVLSNNFELCKKLAVLNDESSYICTMLERSIGQALNASCSVPLGVHATIKGHVISVNAVVYDIQNNQQISSFVEDNYIAGYDYLSLAKRCVSQLIAAGSIEILKKYH